LPFNHPAAELKLILIMIHITKSPALWISTTGWRA